MSDEEGFGMAHVKAEGMPAHPDDLYSTDWDELPEGAYERQLKAYNDWRFPNE